MDIINSYTTETKALLIYSVLYFICAAIYYARFKNVLNFSFDFVKMLPETISTADTSLDFLKDLNIDTNTTSKITRNILNKYIIFVIILFIISVLIFYGLHCMAHTYIPSYAKHVDIFICLIIVGMCLITV